MKNIYNMISDAFAGLGYQEHREENYNVKVTYTDGILRSYVITIISRDQEVTGHAFLHLVLDQTNNLVDYDDTNDLFINENWDRFCLTFDNYIQIPPLVQGYMDIVEDEGSV